MSEPSRNDSKGNSAAPAHVLYVELATRISTRRLHYRSGQEETAAFSLYSLFGKTRDLMVAHPDALEFHEVALFLLNKILRPYTSRWHGWMGEEGGNLGLDNDENLRFRDERIRRKFRAELRELQPLLLGVSKYLRALSQGEESATEWLNASRDSPIYKDLSKEYGSRSSRVSLGSRLPLEIRSEVPLYGTNEKGIDRAQQVTKEIKEKESQSIKERREAMELSLDTENTVGLAFSGGGIRSATFCLGVAQSLHRYGIFNQVDYLSTVSGGGYLGTFLSSFLGTQSQSEKEPSSEKAEEVDEIPSSAEPPKSRVEEVLGGGVGLAESTAIRHLRNNSKYLLNGGAWGKIRIAGVFITGLLASFLMLSMIPLLAAWGAWVVKWLAEQTPLSELDLLGGNPPLILKQPGAHLLVLLAALSAISWIVMLFFQRLAEGENWGDKLGKIRGFFGNSSLVLGISTVLVFGLCTSYLLVDWYESLRTWLTSVQGLPKVPEWTGGLLASIVPIVFGVTSKKGDGSPRRWSAMLFYLTGPLFFLLTFLIFASHLGIGARDVSEGVLGSWLGVTVALILWAFLGLNINVFAPHRYYRDRLCECYLALSGKSQRTLVERGFDTVLYGSSVERTEELTNVGVVKSLPLTSLGKSAAAPYHLINTVLNAEASKNPELRGRNGDFFLFSHHYCGSPLTGYIPTKEMEEANPHVDLGTAMAISGAAASTNMGSKTVRQMRFLMTLFNVRLGYWMRRPGSSSVSFFGPGPISFLREMLGAVHERTRFVNLSDGGHIENLAAYELLRRQCKFIVCVDAGMDQKMECADLMRLQRLVEIDFGIQMHFDLGDLRLQPNGHSRAHAILVKIDYAPDEAQADRETSEQLGWMLYLKLATTGAESAHVLDYRRQYPDFPHQSTGDQLYEEAQFESYRSLGETAASSFFREEIIGDHRKESSLKVEEWFGHLAANLLPDNDEMVSQPEKTEEQKL